MHIRHDATPRPLAPREDSDTAQANPMGVLMVAPTFMHGEVITPGASLLAFPTDGLSVATDGTITITSADAPTATPFAVTLKAGEIHNISAAKVTASTAGAVIGWWHRKPAATP